MNFCIITHVPHGRNKSSYFAYAPYVKEMNIWFDYVDTVSIVAPLTLGAVSEITEEYREKPIHFIKVKSFNFLTFKSSLLSVLGMPFLCYTIFKAMKKADHIHLRCPGNMGLIGSFIQIFFPNTPKTAKYAGNWDPKSKQPLSYVIQKWLLSSTFLTRNIKVLVYGEWEHQSSNITSFFTASYREEDKEPIQNREFDGVKTFYFIGTLSPGKQPIYALQIIKELHDRGENVELIIYGDGAEKGKIEKYIHENAMEKLVFLKGNQTQDLIKRELQRGHFLILPSKSEGWPKVIAEAMFWGCFPIATDVSCVKSMFDTGERGLLLTMDITKDIASILALLKNTATYNQKTLKAVNWSRKYTLNFFENEVKSLLVKTKK